MVWCGHHGRTEGGWARHFPRPEDDWFDQTISWSYMKFKEALNIHTTSWNWPWLHRGGRRVEGGSRGRHSSAANTRVQGEMFFSASVSLRSVPMYMSYYHYMTTWWEGGWDNCKTSFANNLRGESDGRLEAILSILGKLKHSKTARTRNFVSSKQGFQSRLIAIQFFVVVDLNHNLFDRIALRISPFSSLLGS